jgi:hypothetical protein
MLKNRTFQVKVVKDNDLNGEMVPAMNPEEADERIKNFTRFFLKNVAITTVAAAGAIFAMALAKEVVIKAMETDKKD